MVGGNRDDFLYAVRSAQKINHAHNTSNRLAPLRLSRALKSISRAEG